MIQGGICVILRLLQVKYEKDGIFYSMLLNNRQRPVMPAAPPSAEFREFSKLSSGRVFGSPSSAVVAMACRAALQQRGASFLRSCVPKGQACAAEAAYLRRGRSLVPMRGVGGGPGRRNGVLPASAMTVTLLLPLPLDFSVAKCRLPGGLVGGGLLYI